jgi:6-phosphogluconolactonase (cycloisomerase 2 family)
MDRRTFNTALMGVAVTSLPGCAALERLTTGEQDVKSVFYQCVGDQLTHWDVDVAKAELTPRTVLAMPSNVQYVWPHPNRRMLYVSSSDAASGNAPNPGKVHRLCAVNAPADGAMSIVGEPAVLPQRPIHNSVDRSGKFAFTCYNNPSNLTVHRINADGSLGALVQQQADLDKGIFAHQILTTPDNKRVILVTRGNRPEAKKAEDPGALKVYDFNAETGQLTPHANLPVGGRGGLGYGPRHLDFHPRKPWLYVSVESQNQVHMHTLHKEGVSGEPRYRKRSTAGGYTIDFPQSAGAIKVHPNGRTVYLSNRANATVPFNDKRVFRGGENNIAVCEIDQRTGEPFVIQHADPRSFHIRTFSIDPTGKLLVAASIVDMNVRDGKDVRYVPAALTVFRINADGTLKFARKYDVELNGKFQWWSGFVELGNSSGGEKWVASPDPGSID